MNKLVSILLICTLPLVVNAAVTPQQNKMTVCNKAAAGKTGEERKAFMKTCLSAKVEAVANPQQNKMKTCNTLAAGKTGDERKAFMKTCLKS